MLGKGSSDSRAWNLSIKATWTGRNTDQAIEFQCLKTSYFHSLLGLGLKAQHFCFHFRRYFLFVLLFKVLFWNCLLHTVLQIAYCRGNSVNETILISRVLLPVRIYLNIGTQFYIAWLLWRSYFTGAVFWIDKITTNTCDFDM